MPRPVSFERFGQRGPIGTRGNLRGQQITRMRNRVAGGRSEIQPGYPGITQNGQSRRDKRVYSPPEGLRIKLKKSLESTQIAPGLRSERL